MTDIPDAPAASRAARPTPGAGRVLLIAGLSPALAFLLLLALDRRLLTVISRGPALLAASVAAAALLTYLLHVMVRALGASHLRWLPWVFGMAAAVSLVRGLSPGLEAGSGSGRTSPNESALIAMLQAAAIPAFACAALRPRQRWLPALLAAAWLVLTTVLVVSAVLSSGWAPVAVAPDGSYTALTRVLHGAGTAFSAGTAVLWLWRTDRSPFAPEAWIGACLVLNALSWLAYLLSARSQDGLWWTSVALGAARFAVPAAGLLVALTSLLLTMERYERQLEQRVRDLIDLGSPRGGRRLTGFDGRRAREQVLALLAPGGLTVATQSVVELATGRVVGVEALARSAGDPGYAPGSFFPDAHAVGLGTELELSAMREALTVLDRLPADQYLAVNLSPPVLDDGRALDLLAATDVSRLVLEITEREAIDDFLLVRSVLDPLRARGLRLAIDDTGAGYAGLRHIVGLRPDIVKLDAELVREIENDTVRGAMAQALLGFTSKTGATLVAEGIDSPAGLQTLLDLGVEYGQGYLLARPVPSARG